MEDNNNNLFPSLNMGIDLKPFLPVMRSWAWLVVLIIVVLGGIGFMVSRAKKPVYTATTLLVVSGFSSSGSSNTDAVTAGEKLAISYSHLLSSSEIINKALSQAGAGLSYDDMKTAINVIPIQDTQLVQISVEYKDPVMAARIANTMVDVFTERLKTDYAANTLAERENLQARLQDLNQQITQLQNDIKQLSESNRSERLQLVNSSITTLQQEINQLSDEIARLQFDMPVENARDPYGRKILATATPSIEEQSAIAIKTAQLQQRQDILRQYQQEYVLISTYGDNASNFDPTITQIQSYLDQLQGTYLTLQQNLKSVQPSNLLRPPSLLQVYKADVPKAPKGSRTLIYTALGTLIGLVLSIIFIYLISILDPHIKDPELISKKYGLPVLALRSKNQISGTTLMEQYQSESPIYEVCRLLQIKIFEQEGNDVILMTSPTSRDGCDSLAANMAAMMAESGKRTLLLDVNMRQSAIPDMFGKINPAGLGEYLSGSVESVDEVVSLTEFPCLSLICAGALTPVHINQLNGQKGQSLINGLKEKYDLVIINTPSMLSTTDALILVPFAKSVVMVVNSIKSTRDDLDRCIKILKGVNARIMGIVLNNTIVRFYQSFLPVQFSRKVFGS